MIDFAQLAAVNLQKLGEDEADQWCERIFKASHKYLKNVYIVTYNLYTLFTVRPYT